MKRAGSLLGQLPTGANSPRCTPPDIPRWRRRVIDVRSRHRLHRAKKTIVVIDGTPKIVRHDAPRVSDGWPQCMLSPEALSLRRGEDDGAAHAEPFSNRCQL